MLILVLVILESSRSQVITNPDKEDGSGNQNNAAGSVAILTPSEGQVVQHRHSLIVRWTGNLSDNVFEGQLLQGTIVIQNLGKIENDGSFELDISKKLPPAEYRIKLVTSQGDIYSKPFKIEAAPGGKKLKHPVLTVLGGIILAFSIALTILFSRPDGGIM